MFASFAHVRHIRYVAWIAHHGMSKDAEKDGTIAKSIHVHILILPNGQRETENKYENIRYCIQM